MPPIKSLLVRNRTIIALTAIIALGMIARFYHIGFQSFWLDELHSAIESDPAYRGSDTLLYILKNVDQQPPIFFLLARVAIFFFGNNEFALRLWPALAGTASIGAMYMLAKELLGRRAALYAALFMAVNAFCIRYSADARPYTIALFFAIMSWWAFVRLLRDLSIRRSLVYVLWSLLLLYTNYFGLFMVMAQGLCGLIFRAYEPDKKRFLSRYLLSASLIGVGFAPLLLLLRSIAQIKSSWISMPGEDVGITYFFEYFDNSDLLKPFLLLLLICFVCRLAIDTKAETAIPDRRQRKVTILFAICAIWIFTALFVPYLRSLSGLPMMVSRYTIMTIPAWLLLLSAGLEQIHAGLIRRLLLGIFCVLSFVHLVIVKRYYQWAGKTQFRELAQFIAADGSPAAPVLTSPTAWHQNYYLKRFHYGGAALVGAVESHIDSLANPQRPQAFWITSAHSAKPADPQLYARLAGSYFIAREAQLLDAWGQLFLPRNYFGDSSLFITAADAAPQLRYSYNGRDTSIALWWGQQLNLATVRLRAGSYNFVVLAKGSPAGGVYPHIRCLVNNQLIGSYYLNGQMDMRRFPLTLSSDTNAVISLDYDNDAAESDKGEDRNAFIRSVIIGRQMH